MRYINAALVFAVLVFAGCGVDVDMGRIRAADREDSFAFWFPPDSNDPPSAPIRELVLSVLRAEGLHPELKGAAIIVPPVEEGRAREVLVTNPKLKGLPLFVYCTISAGSAVKTPNGFEVPEWTVVGDAWNPSTAPALEAGRAVRCVPP